MSVCDIKPWECRSGSDATAGAERLGAAEVIGGTCHENWGAHGPVRTPSAEEEVLERSRGLCERNEWAAASGFTNYVRVLDRPGAEARNRVTALVDRLNSNLTRARLSSLRAFDTSTSPNQGEPLRSLSSNLGPSTCHSRFFRKWTALEHDGLGEANSNQSMKSALSMDLIKTYPLSAL